MASTLRRALLGFSSHSRTCSLSTSTSVTSHSGILLGHFHSKSRGFCSTPFNDNSTLPWWKATKTAEQDFVYRKLMERCKRNPKFANGVFSFMNKFETKKQNLICKGKGVPNLPEKIYDDIEKACFDFSRTYVPLLHFILVGTTSVANYLMNEADKSKLGRELEILRNNMGKNHKACQGSFENLEEQAEKHKEAMAKKFQEVEKKLQEVEKKLEKK